MLRVMMIFLAGIFIMNVAMVQAEDIISVNTMPPVVVSTLPEKPKYPSPDRTAR